MPGPDDVPYLVVLTTLGNVDDAREFVRELVSRRVVACGTILPNARSIYRWKGAVTEATETVVLLKTHRGRWQELLDAAHALHPYEVPELLALPVIRGLDAYLDWIASETMSGGSESV